MHTAELAKVYPQLLEHALLNLSAEDVLKFLGRKLHPRFEGEVLTDLKKGRHPGARIKHRMKNNWLKMYDKFGQILRIETVINQPREFKVRRRRERNACHRVTTVIIGRREPRGGKAATLSNSHENIGING